MARQRDYDLEYKRDHSSTQAKKDRAARNAAHRKLNPPQGTEVDHIQALSKGGRNNASNLRVVSRKTNRTKGAK